MNSICEFNLNANTTTSYTQQRRSLCRGVMAGRMSGILQMWVDGGACAADYLCIKWLLIRIAALKLFMLHNFFYFLFFIFHSLRFVIVVAAVLY